jgi:hypothetical protein
LATSGGLARASSLRVAFGVEHRDGRWAVFNVDATIEILDQYCLASGEADSARMFGDLKESFVPAHRVVWVHGHVVFESTGSLDVYADQWHECTGPFQRRHANYKWGGTNTRGRLHGIMGELARDKGIAVGLWDQILVIYYEQTPTTASVAVIDSAAERMTATVEHVRAIIAVESQCRVPGSDVREATKKTMQRFEKKTDAIAYVVIGEGFGSVAVRAAIAGIQLVVRPAYPVKVFANVRNALLWLRSLPIARGSSQQKSSDDAIEHFCTPSRHPGHPPEG